MSRGPGRRMRAVLDLLGSEPGRAWTARELAVALDGEDPPTEASDVGTRRALRGLVARGRVARVVAWRLVGDDDPDDG